MLKIVQKSKEKVYSDKNLGKNTQKKVKIWWLGQD